MKTVNVHQAKTQLSRLIAAAERGEEVVIAKAGKPVVRLVAIKTLLDRSGFTGSMKGKIKMLPGFDDPLPPDIQRYFEGEAD